MTGDRESVDLNHVPSVGSGRSPSCNRTWAPIDGGGEAEGGGGEAGGAIYATRYRPGVPVAALASFARAVSPTDFNAAHVSGALFRNQASMPS